MEMHIFFWVGEGGSGGISKDETTQEQ